MFGNVIKRVLSAGCLSALLLTSASAVDTATVTAMDADAYLAQADVQEAIAEVSGQTLQLAIDGNMEAASEAYKSNPITTHIVETPDILEAYIQGLDAYDKTSSPRDSYSVNDDGAQVNVYPDGSFSYETIAVEKVGNSKVTRDPIDLVITGREDYSHTIVGIIPSAECHLITDYKYGYYWVELVDVNVSVRTFPGTSLISKDAAVVSASSSAIQTKGDFQLGDVAGTFGVILKTSITNGNSRVYVSNSKILI